MSMKLCLPSRFTVCFATWFAVMALYFLRTNLNVAILSMTKPTSKINNDTFSSCIKKDIHNPNVTDKQGDNEFSWDDVLQGQLLGSFFQGYASTHLVGALASAKIGPRIAMSVTIFGTTMFCFLTPFFSRISPYALMGARVLGGMFSGPLYPIIQEILGVWTPASERTLLASLTHSGNIFGLVGVYAIGGYMCGGFAGNRGWEYFFYFTGGIGVLAGVLWLFFGFDSPASHPCITSSEQQYITGNRFSSDTKNERKSLTSIPFRQIFLSVRVWAVTSAHFAHLCIFYALVVGHAKFLKDVYGISVKEASFFSMIPFVGNFLVQCIYPGFVDFLRSTNYCSISTIRKITSLVAFLGGAAFLIATGFLKCDQMYIVIIFMTLSLSFIGLNVSGYLTAAIDIGPEYAGITMGLMNTFGSLSGFISPVISGQFLKSGDKKIGYRNTFMIISAMSLFFGLIFCVFGSSDNQKWGTKQCYTALEPENVQLIDDEDSVHKEL